MKTWYILLAENSWTVHLCSETEVQVIVTSYFVKRNIVLFFFLLEDVADFFPEAEELKKSVAATHPLI